MFIQTVLKLVSESDRYRKIFHENYGNERKSYRKLNKILWRWSNPHQGSDWWMIGRVIAFGLVASFLYHCHPYRVVDAVDSLFPIVI